MLCSTLCIVFVSLYLFVEVHFYIITGVRNLDSQIRHIGGFLRYYGVVIDPLIAVILLNPDLICSTKDSTVKINKYIYICFFVETKIKLCCFW